ncbi:MAG: hypothetical protein GX837_11440, partial [Methanomicrobiales archaeon]|nr:hypothetical protein [Methanomicrobiales archaeon]
MTKQAYLMLLCAVIAIGLMISPAVAVETAPGDPFYCRLDKAQEHPDIDGNMIVWEDDRNGNKDIYFGTVDKFKADPYLGNQYVSYTGEKITNNPASQEKPSISGDYIVWQDNRNGDWDIYLYRRSTYEERRLTGDAGNQWMPAICGNYAAWYDDSSGRTNVVLYDINAGKVKTTIDCNAHTRIPGATATTEFKPALSEKYVAWIEESDRKVYYYDIAAGGGKRAVSTSTAEQSWPSLHGGIIVWEDYRHAGTRPDIYMVDLDAPSRKEIQITDADNDQVSPAIGENIIAWEDKRGAPDSVRSIYMYDISREREMPVVLSVDRYDEHLYPAVSGNTIVWQRGQGANSNLYIFVYDPEELDAKVTTIEVTPPSSTLAIGDTEQFSATAFDQNGD